MSAKVKVGGMRGYR